ncbi:pyridoxamine 5'-phosphate oxidase family protein [uncultured Ramlibacter sp.]|uniref:pyridoxamine 5'-phosphate oxidase family protein n=1 Tax=uncultured Ramlibacter sp. TaxID=260755 RepID=UPI00345BD06B
MQPAFHAGEVALQQRAGSADHLAQIGPRVIRDHMPQQHQDFFAQLPLLVLGALDDHGQPWASVLAGPPGFAHAPHERMLRVDALPPPHDPLHGMLRDGVPIGLLGIESHTRRRNRMNGTVLGADARGFGVTVAQSFGNCPKYIQARRPQYDPVGAAPSAWQDHDGLDVADQTLVAQADTFFIASAHPQAGQGVGAHGMDVSHRGGKPGFVRVQGDVLTVPDFAGNAFFNTLGNLALNPRCGLLFMDVAAGTALFIAAHAEIVTDAAQVLAFEGAQRLLRLRVLRVRRVEAALPLRWGTAELSPHLQGTGSWR